ncbi:hypothetical protein ABK040_014796 [Willaertia magna]
MSSSSSSSSSSGSQYIIQDFPNDYVNPRRIPKADFIEDVEAFVTKKTTDPTDVTSIVRDHQQKLQNYMYFEMRLNESKEQLKVKLPEIKKTIEALKFLQQSFNPEDETEALKEVDSHFKLDETVFVDATIPKTDKVALWLGCNVMVEYTLDEALQLLEKNKQIADQRLEELNEDIAYLKDQKTTTEVNISRIHNYGVKKRNEKKNENK